LVPKKAVFYIAALTIPVLFFVLVEAGLRVAGYGDDHPLFLTLESHPHLLYPNPEVAARYFSRQQSLPSIPFDAFAATKDEQSLRVFIQGGSTAAGFPFYFGASLADLLEDRLRASLPDRNVEVVGTAMAAVNSFTLLDFADEIIEQSPDLVVIYAGHNEFYGALGAASTESMAGSVGLVRLYLALSRWRTVQLVRSLLSSSVGLFADRSPGEAPGPTLMAKMVGEQSIPLNSPTFDRGVRQFEANLEALLSRYESAGIPVVIGTLASNVRDQPPFISGSDGPGSAADYFDQARTLEASGDTQSARQAFLDAKDRDELRFRAPEVFNEVIRSAAEDYGAIVAEVLLQMEAESDFGTVGAGLMTEHLHPNADGYFAMADAFYEAIARAGDQAVGVLSDFVYVDRETAKANVVFSELDSLLGDYRIRVLKGSWPFVPASVAPTRPKFVTNTEVERVAGQVYTGELGRPAGLERIRHIQLEEGRIDAALESGRALLQRYWFLPEPFLAVGDLLVANGRPEEAFDYYRRSNALEESQIANRMMGSILLNAGRRNESIGYLERAVAMDGRDPRALYNLAGAFALTGRISEARATVERLLELNPRNEAALKLQASLPKAGG
jgi:tetratricopeptide (TPR) repeat protein